MERFDCLAAETPLFGPHFLEASAGTGKTFAIEHIVARLILSGVDLEQILVVTFTRAAARELKLRVRSNLERICSGASLAYLPSDCKLIAEALASFDRCQIFTIHGFCSRMLKEFAFEAGLQLGFKEAKDPGVDRALKDFFELKIAPSMVSIQQLDRLVRSAGSVEGLARKLKRQEKPQGALLYSERAQAFHLMMRQCPHLLANLREEFAVIQANYKKMDGDFFGQIEALKKGDFESLISEKESIFSYTAPENKKVKAKDLPVPVFFDWGRIHLLPLIESAQDPKETLNTLLVAWKPIQERVLLDSGILGPDELILGMSEAIKNNSFREKVQAKFRAVLIDEFQDTDPVQWALFETLFLKTTEALYLIGDPKQSIYRFRKADLYTYLKAKESIPEEGHFHLDTNFRSSKPLIDALNGLFDRQWLYLPREKRSLPYLPVRAGLELESDFGDEKGAVHCVRLEKEESFLYVASEVLRLKEKVASWGSFAVLVKDRYQAAEMQRVFAELNVPSVARSQEPLCETVCFCAVRELFDALKDPRDLGKAKTVLAGPFGGFTATQIQRVTLSPFVDLRNLLDEKGIAVLCQMFTNTRFGERSVQENIVSQGVSFYAEWSQLLELIFEWEQSFGFSFEGLNRFFDRLERLDPDEAICRRKESEADSVQIMTMHVSKGLEFDVVFALGVGTRTPECDEEAESEKLRQLYVALTRAKRRLYIPIPFENKEAKAGTRSPIELFCKALSPEGLWEAELSRLSLTTSLTIEHLQNLAVPHPAPKQVGFERSERVYKIPTFQSSYLLSFTSIAQEVLVGDLAPMPEINGVYTAQNLPRGSETGVMIHRMFERVFTEDISINEIVEQEIGSLFLWKKAVVDLIQASLDLPLSFGFCLRDIPKETIRVEVEFLFSHQANYVKGFIDLLFVHKEKLYFVDWKTNWLPDYSKENLEEAIHGHQYQLQASIYTEALKREWSGEIGGAIYLFVRGPQASCFQGELYD
jgi:exodeoxyribonuclease V beta subunit